MTRNTALAPLIIAGVVLSSLVIPSRSEALGSETLACSVSNGKPAVFHEGACAASTPRSSYVTTLRVSGESGTYSFGWAFQANTSITVIGGCTFTSDFCTLQTPAVNSDNTLSASVTLLQNGQVRTISAIAFIPATCGNEFC